MRCSDELRNLVKQFNSGYNFSSQTVPTPRNHPELVKFITSFVTGSSEKLSKQLLSRVTRGTGFYDLRDRLHQKKRRLGFCWTHDCCGADKGEFNVPVDFREKCKLTLSAKEKFIELRDNSDLTAVYNSLKT